MLLHLHRLRKFRQNLHFTAYLKKNRLLFLCLIISLYFKCNGAEGLEEEIQGAIELSPTGHNYRSEESSRGDDKRTNSIEELENSKENDLLSKDLQALEKKKEQQTSLLCGLDGLFDSASATLTKAQAEHFNENIRDQQETSGDLFAGVITETKRLSRQEVFFSDDNLRKSLAFLRKDLENCRSHFLVCQEIIKFNKYSIQKMEPYEHISRWNGLLTSHRKLRKKALEIIKEEAVSMSDRLREIKEKLDIEDECKVSIKCREEEKLSLKIAVPKKSLAIYFFIEKGTVPYTVKVKEWLNYRRYLPWSIESNIGILNFNITSSQDQEEDNDEYCKSWDVNSSYISFALDKLVENINGFCEKPLECIDFISGYPNYTNERYYFSQVLSDYFQIRPISSFAELRDNCSSNEEVARYFFSRAEHIPGYRSGIL